MKSGRVGGISANSDLAIACDRANPLLCVVWIVGAGVNRKMFVVLSVTTMKNGAYGVGALLV